MNKEERLQALPDEGGLQNVGILRTVKACPKGIPLTKSLAEMKDVTLLALKNIFRK